MYKESVGSTKTSNAIIANTISNLSDDEKAALPEIASIKRTMRNLISKCQEMTFIAGYDIPEELLTTKSGCKFVQYDTYGSSNKRILGFWNHKIVEHAKLAKVFAMDATFFACHRDFYQLFVIYFLKEHRFIPFAYFLMPDKIQCTYIDIFVALK